MARLLAPAGLTPSPTRESGRPVRTKRGQRTDSSRMFRARMLLELSPHLGGIGPVGVFELLLVFRQEMVCQEKYVLSSGAQGRYGDGVFAEAVVESRAKSVPLYHVRQGRVCRGDDADVHTDGLLAPDGVELLLLNRLEQLRLEAEGQVADLIEEYGSTRSQLETTGLRFMAPGECSSFVAEKLGFQKRLRNGRAINLDEGLGSRPEDSWISWAITSLPVPLSPRSRTFTREAATLRDLMPNFIGRRALPEKGLRMPEPVLHGALGRSHLLPQLVALLFELMQETSVLQSQAAMLQGSPNHLQHHRHLARLADVVGNMLVNRGLRGFERGVSCEK